MKKLFLGVMMVALIITSCNKYANDFQALKDQIAALATQVTGVTTLENTIATQTAQIAALQTAINALPSNSAIAAQFTTLAGQLSTIQGNITSISGALTGIASTGTANAAALAALTTTLNGVVTAKTAADAALNATLATLQSTLAADIAAGTAANAAAIASAQSSILDQITASSMSTDANVNAQIAAAQAALQTLINDGLSATNANVTAQVSAAQTALTSLINSQLAAVQTAIQQSIADGTTATNAHTDAQIAALTAVLNAGLMGVNGNIAGVSQQVTDAQTAILALVTSTSATLNDNIAAAQLALENLVNSTATATQSSINGTIGALQTALTILINAGNTSTIAQIQATQAAIIGGPGDTATSLTIHGLQLALAQAQAEINTLVAESAMYNGDVTIQSDADVDFYFGKVNQMGIINGNVSITTHGTTPVTEFTKLNTILGNIVAVIGVNSSTYSITTTQFWPGIVNTVTLNVTPGTGHWVWVSDMLSDGLVMNHLNTVRGDYTVLGGDIDDSGLTQVGGTYTLNYAGNYEALLLASVGGNMILVDQSSNGTGYINFPIVTVDPAHFVGNGTPAIPVSTTVSFNSTNTTWINFGLATGAQINNLTANSANKITLGTMAYNALGLAVTAHVATDIELGAAASSVGPVTIATGLTAATGTATTVNLSALATSGPLTVWAAGSGNVMLNVFNSAVAVDIEGPLSLTIPVWLGLNGSTLNAPMTQTLVLPMYEWLSFSYPATIPVGVAGLVPNISAIKTLTLGNAVETVNIGAYATLLNADITGVTLGVPSHWADINGGSTGLAVATDAKSGVRTAGNPLLNTVKLGGLMNTVNISTTPLLTNINTWGIINSTTLNAVGTTAPGLTALTLGHANFQGDTGFGGPGSDLVLTNNSKLMSVTTTALDKMQSIWIHDNAALATLNLGSYNNIINSIALLVDVDIYNNNLSGSFTPALAPFGTTPYKEATITCMTLQHLRDYIHMYKNAYGDSPATFASFRVDVDHCPTTTTLGTLMNGNKAVSTVIGAWPAVRTATTAIANDAQMQLIQ